MRTRTRSGCFSCRSKKRKCDSVRPRCSLCQRRGEQCRYGVIAAFHPSRELRLSPEDSATLLVVEEARGGPQTVTRFVDNTAQIVHSYEDGYGTLPEETEDYEESHRGSGVSCGAAEIFHFDDAASDDNTFAQSSVSTGCAPCTEVGVTTTTPAQINPRDASDVITSVHETVNTSSSILNSTYVAPAYFDFELPVPKSEQIQLVRAYLKETGIWCEATDTGRHFTVFYIHSLMNNKPFAAAAMALASRQQDAVCRSPRESTSSLYQHAVRSLLHYEPSQCGKATLACCVLLSVYEAMTSDVAEWRRHLKGCVANLTNKGWNGSSPALVGAAFWAFARIDIWAAYLLGEQTLVPPENWLSHDDSASSAATLGTTDNYCNLATHLLARIVNLVAGGVRPEDLASVELNALWNKLQAWHTHRPQQILPLLRTHSNRRNPFPMILLAGDSSVCGNTFYHTGCILLLRTGQISTSRGDAETTNPIWHAKELCGISIANESHACWVNQVHPLYIAGQAFQTTFDEDRGEEHVAEKFALLKHLAKIERDTGWPTSSKASALRRLWGLG